MASSRERSPRRDQTLTRWAFSRPNEASANPHTPPPKIVSTVDSEGFGVSDLVSGMVGGNVKEWVR
jgi:hypothetical protein